jgi:riboflavin biosynthesis pyrimidine reductase
MTPEFRRLMPDPAELDADALLAPLRHEAPKLPDRPYTIANFVASADGRAAFGGRSSPLGDDGDRALFHALRERADGVLAGTGTLRAERYGRLIPSEDRRARRRAAGMPPEPIACVISRSGTQLPLEIPLFAEPSARVVLFSPSDPDLETVSAQVSFHRLASAPTGQLNRALHTLRAEHGVQLLLCEGGPSLFSSLLHERLVDELFMTIAPKLAGGDSGPSLTRGSPLSELEVMRLVWLLERDGSLYLRYRLT